MRLVKIIHERHKIVRDRYGHTAAHATHLGEGAYLSASLWLDHHLMFYVYGGLFGLWIVHTVIVGLED
jgi:hypothetical protein